MNQQGWRRLLSITDRKCPLAIRTLLTSGLDDRALRSAQDQDRRNN